MEFKQSREHIVQNLIDAGCDDKFISLFLNTKECELPDKIPLLFEQRELILEKIHKAQKILNVIDGAIEILPEDGR